MLQFCDTVYSTSIILSVGPHKLLCCNSLRGTIPVISLISLAELASSLHARISRSSAMINVAINVVGYSKQESHAVAGKPRDAAVNSDRYRVRWHFAGAISVNRMQSVSGCTVYA